MHNRLRPTVILSLLCLLSCPRDASAKDWPQWGGTDARNMASEEKGLPDTFEPGKKTSAGIDMATTKKRPLGRPARRQRLLDARGG